MALAPFTKRALAAIAIAAACVGLAALAARRARHDEASPATPSASASAERAVERPPAPPAGPAELALVAPLVVGAHLKDWTVREIRAVKEGTLSVIFAEDQGKGRIELLVALLDPEGLVPPASAGRYAIFYSVKWALPEDGERLAKRLARVIEENADAPPPPGLAPYRPHPKEPDPL